MRQQAVDRRVGADVVGKKEVEDIRAYTRTEAGSGEPCVEEANRKQTSRV
jgi:hypothetical protein